MPRPTRDQRRAAKAATAAAWATWLAAALSESATTASELAAAAALLRPGENAPFNKSAVSHWVNGDSSVSPENALLVARVLHRDPVEALRAAGHHTLADRIVELVKEAIHGERLLAQAKDDGSGDNDRTAL